MENNKISLIHKDVLQLGYNINKVLRSVELTLKEEHEDEPSSIEAVINEIAAQLDQIKHSLNSSVDEYFCDTNETFSEDAMRVAAMKANLLKSEVKGKFN